MNTCKKPCHDCPFRKDNPSYQREEDLARNVEAVVGGLLPHCHHSTLDVSTGLERSGPPVRCAGGVILSVKIGRNPESLIQSLGLKNVECVYGSTDEMVEAVSKTRTSLARFSNWWVAQPVHVRLKLVKAGPWFDPELQTWLWPNR